MDWSSTGALAGATIVAGVVGFYGTLTLLGSGASQPTAHRPPVLLPSRERPAVANVSPIPASPDAPTQAATWGDPASVAGSAPTISTLGEYPAPNQYGSAPSTSTLGEYPAPNQYGTAPSTSTLGEYPAPNQYDPRLAARRPAVEPPVSKAHGSHAPPGSSDSAKRRPAAPQESVFAGTGPSTPRVEYSNRPGGRMSMDAKPTVEISGRRPPPEGQKKTAPTMAPQSKEAVRPELEEWKVITTAKATPFNLGGHVDRNGIIDSLASSHFRDAIKKHPNYPKLPQRIQTAMEAPNISLVKLAPYRTHLGISDKKIEEEQGVKFVRVASIRGVDLGETRGVDLEETRGVDLGELEMANVPALELGPFPAQ
jgi:hypothetical protein